MVLLILLAVRCAASVYEKNVCFFIEHKSIKMSPKVEDEKLIRSMFVMNVLMEESKNYKENRK